MAATTSSDTYHEGLQNIFAIINPVKNYATCVGQSKAAKRRCYRRISVSRADEASKAIQQMTSVITLPNETRLHDMARLTLCHDHRSQETEVKKAWQQEWNRCFDDVVTSAHIKTEPAEPVFTPKSESSPVPAPTFNSKSSTNSKPAPIAAEPLTNREAWDLRWTNYLSAWTSLDSTSNKADHTQIPWPTRSGTLADVTERNVRRFFLRALPATLTPAEMYSILNKENKKWHTDKMIHRFGKKFVEGPDGDKLTAIARVVIDLWQNAKAHKSNL